MAATTTTTTAATANRPRIAVYTANFGAFDNEAEWSLPVGWDVDISQGRVDVILFTDGKTSIRKPFTRVIAIPNTVGDFCKMARRVKILAHEYLPEYDVSIWFDCAYRIKVANLDALFEHFDASALPPYLKNGHLMAYMKYKPSRPAYEAQNAYETANVLKQFPSKETARAVDNAVAFLRRENYPTVPETPAPDACVLVRLHNNRALADCMDLWFNTVAQYSRRDQLSFNYALWRHFGSGRLPRALLSSDFISVADASTVEKIFGPAPKSHTGTRSTLKTWPIIRSLRLVILQQSDDGRAQTETKHDITEVYRQMALDANNDCVYVPAHTNLLVFFRVVASAAAVAAAAAINERITFEIDGVLGNETVSNLRVQYPLVSDKAFHFAATVSLPENSILASAVPTCSSAALVCPFQTLEQIKEAVKGLGIQISPPQMLEIVQTIDRPVNFLVFGLGYDSGFWVAANPGGKTVFIEQSQDWIDSCKKKWPTLDVYHAKYTTLRPQWADLLAKARCGDTSKLAELCLPHSIVEEKWDLILVDAPTGFDDRQPGRMQSIFAARQLADKNERGTHLFCHDVDRPVEREYTAHFFGVENHVCNLGVGERVLSHHYIKPASAATSEKH